MSDRIHWLGISGSGSVAHAVPVGEGRNIETLLGGFSDCPVALCGKKPSARSFWRPVATRTTAQVPTCKSCRLALPEDTPTAFTQGHAIKTQSPEAISSPP